MSCLIPNRFLFAFEFRLAYRAEMPPVDGALRGWTDAERLPSFAGLESKSDFAPVWACWNESGLAMACRVENKRKPLRCEPSQFWKGDNLRLCIDMRDARDIKRATRYCQQFFFLPTGGGAARNKPAAGVGTFQRAREDAPPVGVERIHVAAAVSRTGYVLEGFIPAACLVGFDPGEHSRIGFFYMLEDGDHGQQYMTVGDELMWYADPSTWATAVLAK